MEDPASPVPPADPGEVVVTARREPTVPATPASQGSADPDTLTLTVGGRIYGGWDEVRVTRGCERLPSSFDITLTERWPGEAAAVVAVPGSTCEVKIGNDKVITGYVDRFVPTLDARSHSVTIMGRSKCQDLVDCAAIWPSYQVSGMTVRAVAEKLAEPYGITVRALNGDGPVVPQYNILPGMTAWDVIETLCRFGKLLAYDDADGNLVLASVGTERHASGVKEGVNLLSGSANHSMDGRFSEYHVFAGPSYLFMQAERSAGGDLLGRPSGEAKDEGVPRFRRMVIMLESDTGGDPVEMARQRAEWEATRRRGRGQAVRLRVDSWRDRAGKLWTPNTLMPVETPSLKVPRQDWIIGEATYSRGGSGTVADLVLMPKEAFQPVYQPLLPSGLQQAEQSANPAAAGVPPQRSPNLASGSGE